MHGISISSSRGRLIYRKFVRSLSMMQDTAPDALKSRVDIIVSGKAVTNALFRAELKKELTFFRGCAAAFKSNPK